MELEEYTTQLSFDDICSDYYKIYNKIRLIELFAGIGSQAKALERIGADFEHYKIVEFDADAVTSYNAVHGTNFEPVDIRNIHSDYLQIVDKDKFTYLMCYSFPCVDISTAGRREGFSKGSGTRSGLLWEVERLLNECGDNLPQVLLMENVKAILSKNTIDDFKEWVGFLASKGYSNFYKVLNAKDYGIPQNRSRCFMVSILGDTRYEFPAPVPLTLKLKDLLQDKVDTKYYISKKMINYISAKGTKNFRNPDCKINLDIARPLTTCQNKRAGTTNYWADDLPANTDLKNFEPQQIEGYRNRNLQETVERNEIKDGTYIDAYNRRVSHDVAGTIMTGVSFRNQTFIGDMKDSDQPTLKIRKLTPKECWRLMGFDDEDFEKAAKYCCDSNLYKQAGNSIVVNVLEAIFKQLL